MIMSWAEILRADWMVVRSADCSLESEPDRRISPLATELLLFWISWLETVMSVVRVGAEGAVSKFETSAGARANDGSTLRTRVVAGLSGIRFVRGCRQQRLFTSGFFCFDRRCRFFV